MPNTLIVYVHGALSTRNSWNYIRQKLVNRLATEYADSGKEMPSEEFIRYDLNKEVSPDIVEKMVEKLMVSLKGFKRLIFIGHSFGGVLSVAAARELAPFLEEQKIKTRIITLSAPFAGSEVASMLRLFKPGSMFFKNIGTHTDFIKQFKAQTLPYKTHIFVTTEGGADWMPQANDGVVTVESQRFFDGDPLCVHQEAKVNHFEILLSDVVVTQLFKEAR